MVGPLHHPVNNNDLLHIVNNLGTLGLMVQEKESRPGMGSISCFEFSGAFFGSVNNVMTAVH